VTGAEADQGLRARYASLRSLEGREQELVIGPVRELEFRRFALASGEADPRYLDADAARALGYPGIIAPPGYLSAVMGWQAGPPAEQLRPDGTSGAEIADLPLEGLRVMGGGQELELGLPVVDGTHVTMRTAVESVKFKQGRSGELIIVTVTRTFVDADGALLVRCRESFIAR
jgi:acyl dehydratase